MYIRRSTHLRKSRRPATSLAKKVTDGKGLIRTKKESSIHGEAQVRVRT